MTVRERILMIRLMEKLTRYPASEAALEITAELLRNDSDKQ